MCSVEPHQRSGPHPIGAVPVLDPATGRGRVLRDSVVVNRPILDHFLQRAAEVADDYVDTAIYGRLWVAFGLDRGLLGIMSNTGFESRVTTYDGLRSLIPLPGWKKRAKKRQYLPYLA